MPDPKKPHPLNIIGDYYVQDGCCMACGVPQEQAPDLFGITDEVHFHCYVKKQPKTPEETEQMLNAIRCAELNCIRYRGTDPAIFTRISASGELDVCDLEPPPGTELGFRTHVTFRVTKPNTPRISVLMRQFKQYLKAQIDSYRKLMDSHPVSRHRLSWLGVSMYRLRFRWWTPRNTMTFLYPPFWQTVRFEILQSDSRTIHISSTPAHHYLIANWLKTLPDTQDVRWYTEEGWSTTGVWHSSYC